MLGHLAVAEKQGKVINVASRLGTKSSHLPLKYTRKVLVFSQIGPHAAFWGLRKGHCAPGSLCWCAPEQMCACVCTKWQRGIFPCQEAFVLLSEDIYTSAKPILRVL